MKDWTLRTAPKKVSSCLKTIFIPLWLAGVWGGGLCVPTCVPVCVFTSFQAVRLCVRSHCGPVLVTCPMVTFPWSRIAFFIALEGYKFFVIPSWVLTSHLKVKSSVSHYCFLGLSSIASDQHVINVLRVCSSFSFGLGSNLRYTAWAHISMNLGKLLLHLCVHAEQPDSSK